MYKGQKSFWNLIHNKAGSVSTLTTNGLLPDLGHLDVKDHLKFIRRKKALKALLYKTAMSTFIAITYPIWIVYLEELYGWLSRGILSLHALMWLPRYHYLHLPSTFVYAVVVYQPGECRVDEDFCTLRHIWRPIITIITRSLILSSRTSTKRMQNNLKNKYLN